MLAEARFPKWLGGSGIAFSFLFLVGAFRNVTPAVQVVADINNGLLSSLDDRDGSRVAVAFQTPWLDW